MTHHPIRILPDGTRVYSNYTRYKPMADEDRTNKVRKPDVPGAVRLRDRWLLPLPLLPDEDRVMPQTRPDEETLLHRAACLCEVCRRPGARKYWRRERLAARLQP